MNQSTQVPERESPTVTPAVTSSVADDQSTLGNSAVASSMESSPDGAAPEVQQFCNAYGDWSVYADDFMGPLPASGATGFHIRQAEYDTVIADLDAFHLQCFGEANFHPSTGPGIFDVSFDPGSPGELTISLRVEFSFVAATSPGDYPGAAPEDLDWQNEEEKATYAAEVISAINGAWSGAMQFKATKPFWDNVLANVEVAVSESSDNPHYTITAQKIPPGEFAGSDASAAGAGSNHGTANFDSEDVNLATKAGGEQRAAVHEFGHMIGLGDEYAGRPTPRHNASFNAVTGETIATGADDRIMSGGETILAEHYITFLEGLRSCTSMTEWGYAT